MNQYDLIYIFLKNIDLKFNAEHLQKIVYFMIFNISVNKNSYL